MTDADARERIVRLERVARRDRLFVVAALALVLASAQAPAPAPPGGPISVGGATISSRGLVVRDAAGITKLDVGMDSNGYPSLDEYGASGAIRQSLYLLDNRPVLRQFDPAGKRRAELYLSSDLQNPTFHVSDAAETTRLAVFIGDKGLPQLSLLGSDGKPRAYVSVDDVGAYLLMRDAAAAQRVGIGKYSDGSFGMNVRNAAGTAVWSKP